MYLSMKAILAAAPTTLAPDCVAAERGSGRVAQCCQSILTFHLRSSATFTMVCQLRGRPAFSRATLASRLLTSLDIRWKDMLTAKRKLEADQVGKQSNSAQRPSLLSAGPTRNFPSPLGTMFGPSAGNNVCRRTEPRLPSCHPILRTFFSISGTPTSDVQVDRGKA